MSKYPKLSLFMDNIVAGVCCAIIPGVLYAVDVATVAEAVSTFLVFIFFTFFDEIFT